MRLPRLVTRAYLGRAAVVWFSMRLVASAALVSGQQSPFGTPTTTILGLALLAAALTLADIHRRHERMLIGNLGVGRVLIFIIAAVPAVAGEITLRLLYSMAT